MKIFYFRNDGKKKLATWMPCCFDGTNVSPKLIDVTQSSKRHAFSPNLKKLKYAEKETSVTNTGQLINI